MVLTIIIVIVVLLLLYGVSIYNKLIRYRNQSEEAAAAIDAHLKQRYDLVPNLVDRMTKNSVTSTVDNNTMF